MSLAQSGLCGGRDEVLRRSRGLIGGGGGGGGVSAVLTTLVKVHMAAMAVSTAVMTTVATAAAKWATESTDNGVDVKQLLYCTS